MSKLICYDCHIFRNKFASTVTCEVIEHGVMIVKKVGYRCIKCTHKKYVENMGIGVNKGWRRNFMMMIDSINKQQKSQVPVVATTFNLESNAAHPVIEENKKDGFGSKIYKFFKRRNM